MRSLNRDMSHPPLTDRVWRRKDAAGDRSGTSGTAPPSNLTQWHDNGCNLGPRPGQWATIVSGRSHPCNPTRRGNGTTDRSKCFSRDKLVEAIRDGTSQVEIVPCATSVGRHILTDYFRYLIGIGHKRHHSELLERKTSFGYTRIAISRKRTWCT